MERMDERERERVRERDTEHRCRATTCKYFLTFKGDIVEIEISLIFHRDLPSKEERRKEGI